MKQLTCEMCGSTDLIKKDGLFVCQSCGTKYTVEEAKKMMIEGTVDVQGTVKVDSSERLQNLYTLARRAKSDGNSENAAKYYEQIAVEDPDSWEAAFYGVYYSSMNCTIAQISSAATSVSNCLESTFELIKKHVQGDVKQTEAYCEVAGDVVTFSSMLFNAARNTCKESSVSGRFQDFQLRSRAIISMLINLGDLLCKYVPSDDSDSYKQALISPFKVILSMYQSYNSETWGNCLSDSEVESIYDRISKIDPSYVRPVKPAEPIKKPSSGGCYVATAVYGSYDCPEVWTLRRYRDYTLAETWYGRAFIRCYYALSPSLVKWFGQTNWFKQMWKGKLDRMVASLKEKGTEDTPYEDREW